jgi:hypothetical protein
MFASIPRSSASRDQSVVGFGGRGLAATGGDTGGEDTGGDGFGGKGGGGALDAAASTPNSDANSPQRSDAPIVLSRRNPANGSDHQL